MNQLINLMEQSLNKGINEKMFPGGVSSVRKTGEESRNAVMGRINYDSTAPEVTEETIYDLASLTKVTATLPSVLLSIQKGRLLLFDTVEKYIPEFCAGRD